MAKIRCRRSLGSLGSSISSDRLSYCIFRRFEAAKVATLKSIAHGFKSIEEVHSSVRSVLSPAFQQALKEDGAWL